MHTDTAEIELARRLEQSISRAPAPTSGAIESVTCGPFRVWFATYTDNRELNYAMPVTPTGSDALRAAVEALRAVFAARTRTLRVEFVEEVWPDLAAALQRSGLHLKAREPLMACTKDEFVPVMASGVSVRALSAEESDAELAVFLQINDGRPTDGSRPVSAKAVAALRDDLRTTLGTFASASIDGRPAGAGRCLFQQDGLGEITGIVTLPEFRNRGVAATLVSDLLRRLFESGRSIAWLNAANEQARSVYARLGFRSIGSLLNYEE